MTTSLTTPIQLFQAHRTIQVILIKLCATISPTQRILFEAAAIQIRRDPAKYSAHLQQSWM
jgi:hypothetical protein